MRTSPEKVSRRQELVHIPSELSLSLISAREAECWPNSPTPAFFTWCGHGYHSSSSPPKSSDYVTQQAGLALCVHHCQGEEEGISSAHFMGSRANGRLGLSIIPFCNKMFSDICRSGI